MHGPGPRHSSAAIRSEILRELILDPTRDYQPTGAPKGPTKQ